MTKSELFKNAIAVIETTSVENKAELIEGLNHEVELLARKASTPRKPTKTQLENEGLKDAVFTFLSYSNTPQTIKEITTGVEDLTDLSNQRVTHLLTALRNEGKVKRTVVKKVPYYEIGTEEKEEG